MTLRPLPLGSIICSLLVGIFNVHLMCFIQVTSCRSGCCELIVHSTRARIDLRLVFIGARADLREARPVGSETDRLSARYVPSNHTCGSMKRAQYLVQYNLKQRVTRTFSHSSVPPKKHIARKLDTTGRTFPFARRAVSTQRSRPPSQPNAGGPTREPPPDKVANALQAASSENTNQLLAPVHIPEDRHGILRTDHPATSILANSSIVVQRQLEMMNVLMGFEQANKYVLMDSTGNHIGFLVEQDHGIGKAVARQMFSTHRSFTTHVFDKNEREILRVN